MNDIVAIQKTTEACCAKTRQLITLLDTIINTCDDREGEDKFEELDTQAHKARRSAYTLLGELGTLSQEAENAGENNE
jgi:hypothetical protein